MKEDEAKSIIEAVLFVSGEPVARDILKDIVGLHGTEVEKLVQELVSEYSLRNSGLVIIEVAGGVQMATNPDCAPWVKKLLAAAVPTRLSQQSLETLAIIAYKQPIIKAEIEAIRGVNSDGVVRTLLERRLIKILGRKEVPGRPLMYGTTRDFLQSFGLKDLSELPTLKEFQDMEEPEVSLPEVVEEISEVTVDVHADAAPSQEEEVVADVGQETLEVPVELHNDALNQQEEPSRQD